MAAVVYWLDNTTITFSTLLCFWHGAKSKASSFRMAPFSSITLFIEALRQSKANYIRNTFDFIRTFIYHAGLSLSFFQVTSMYLSTDKKNRDNIVRDTIAWLFFYLFFYRSHSCPCLEPHYSKNIPNRMGSTMYYKGHICHAEKHTYHRGACGCHWRALSSPFLLFATPFLPSRLPVYALLVFDFKI